MILSEDWTTGYTIELKAGQTIIELVNYVLEQNRADLPHAQKVDNVSQAFALEETDAERVIERVAAGILFAAFNDHGHVPDAAHDPIAHTSYLLAITRRQQLANIS